MTKFQGTFISQKSLMSPGEDDKQRPLTCVAIAAGNKVENPHNGPSAKMVYERGGLMAQNLKIVQSWLFPLLRHIKVAEAIFEFFSFVPMREHWGRRFQISKICQPPFPK